MQTKYQLDCAGTSFTGTFDQLRNYALALDIDQEDFISYLAQMQLGLRDVLDHFDGHETYQITITHDQRMRDHITAFSSFDPTPKHRMRNEILHSIAIAIGNAESEDDRLHLQILHSFFLTI